MFHIQFYPPATVRGVRVVNRGAFRKIGLLNFWQLDPPSFDVSEVSRGTEDCFGVVLFFLQPY